MNPLRTVFSRLSPSGEKGRLSVLIFHRVHPTLDPLFPNELDADRFDQMLNWIKNWFNVIPLDDAVSRLQESTLPERAAAITFDDGYADNREVALPILLKHNLTATFFIATGFLDGGRMWNDTIIEAIRRSKTNHLDLGDVIEVEKNKHSRMPIVTLSEKRIAIESVLGQIKYLSGLDRESAALSLAEQCGADLPDNLMMTSDQVVEMRKGGMLIGAHTLTHPILATIEESEALKEICLSKQYLESLLQERVTLFAYPNGKPNRDYQAKDVMVVKNLGFEAAVTTAWGVANHESDRMQLPRFTPWDRSKLKFGARLVRNILQNRHLRQNQNATQ